MTKVATKTFKDPRMRLTVWTVSDLSPISFHDIPRERISLVPIVQCTFPYDDFRSRKRPNLSPRLSSEVRSLPLVKTLSRKDWHPRTRWDGTATVTAHVVQYTLLPRRSHASLPDVQLWQRTASLRSKGSLP